MADQYTALGSISHSKGEKQTEYVAGDVIPASALDDAEVENLLARGLIAEGPTVPVAEQPTPSTPTPSGRAEAEAAQAEAAAEKGRKK